MKINKSIASLFIFGMILTIIGSIGATSVFGQSATEEECDFLYQLVFQNRAGPGVEEYETAVAAGREYLKTCNNQKQKTEYIKQVLPELEKKLSPKVETLEDLISNKNGNWYVVNQIVAGKELRGAVFTVDRWQFLDGVIDYEGNATYSKLLVLGKRGQVQDNSIRYFSFQLYETNCAEQTFFETNYAQSMSDGKFQVFPSYDKIVRSFSDQDKYSSSTRQDKKMFNYACKQANIISKQLQKEAKKALSGKN